MLKKSFLLLGWLMGLAFGAAAQEEEASTGKEPATLTGTITDKKNGEALIGATVKIIGTYKGGVANYEGKYTIKGIKPGDYSVKFTFVGYTKVVHNGITFKPGETKTLDIRMTEASQVIEEEAIVVGEKAMVDLESAKSEVTLNADLIKEMNTKNVQEIAATQNGVSRTPDGLQIRGGRVYETQYMVDGISAQDPLAGTGFGVEVGSNAVQSLSVVLGNASPEYSDGTSGTIITQIKEGSDEFKVTGSWQRDNLGLDRDWQTSWNTDNVDVSFGGPIIKEKTHFFTAFNARLTDTYFRPDPNDEGLRQILRDENLPTDDPLTAAGGLESSLVDGDIYAPRQDNSWSGTVKLSHKFSPKLKVSITNQHSVKVNQNTRTLQIIGNDEIMTPGLQYRFAGALDDANTFTHRSNLTALNLRYNLNNKWSLKVNAGRLFSALRQDANGLEFQDFRDGTIDRNFFPASIVRRPEPFPLDTLGNGSPILATLPGPGLVNNGGVGSEWHDHYVDEYTFKYKFQHFVPNNKHVITFGQEHKEQDLQWIDVTSPWVGAPIRLSDTTLPSRTIGTSSDIWSARPATGSFFGSDEIKYNGIQANLGLTFKYWAYGSRVDELTEAKADNPRRNANIPITTIDAREYQEKTTGLFGGRRFSARILPKIAVSFPVKENMSLYFNYGHSMRLPHPRFVYAGLDTTFQDRSNLSNIGNPNLNPEVSVSYEVGLKTQITKDLGLTLTAYNTDKFDYIVNRRISILQNGQVREKTIAINQDYALVRGVEVGGNYRISKLFRAMLNVSFMQARGKSNTAAESARQIRTQGRTETTEEQPLAWDRPWDIKGTFIFTPDESVTIKDFSLDGFRAFLYVTYKSGLRYTPYRAAGVDSITGRTKYEQIPSQRLAEIGPSWFWVDFKLTRDIDLPGTDSKLSFSFEIKNLLNNDIDQIINPVTGRAYRDGDPLPFNRRDPRFNEPNKGGTPPYNPARFRAPRQFLYGVSYSF